MKLMSSVIGVLALTVVGVAAVGAAPAETGLWRFTIRYDFVGIPQTFPSYEKTQCLTEMSLIPDISRPGQECTTQPRGRFGNVQTWLLDCSTEWESAQGAGRITFGKGKATGDVHIQIINPYNAPEFMVFHIEGKRLGDCKKQ